MKKYSLSSAAERITIIGIFVFMITLFSTLIVFLYSTAAMPMLVGAAIFILALYGTYVFSVLASSCKICKETGQATIYGLRKTHLNLSDSRSICTQEFEMGSNPSRRILFLGDEGNVVAAFGTFFFAHRGAQAEKLAMQIAEDMDIIFTPSLPAWEYDPELRKEHEKEVAAKEKAARKAKFQALKNKLLRRPNAEESAPSPLEEDGDIDLFEGESDGVNYDALDDEK